jgi:hypothetical protein
MLLFHTEAASKPELTWHEQEANANLWWGLGQLQHVCYLANFLQYPEWPKKLKAQFFICSWQNWGLYVRLQLHIGHTAHLKLVLRTLLICLFFIRCIARVRCYLIRMSVAAHSAIHSSSLPPAASWGSMPNKWGAHPYTASKGDQPREEWKL